jgi:hypothetical protein
LDSKERICLAMCQLETEQTCRRLWERGNLSPIKQW